MGYITIKSALLVTYKFTDIASCRITLLDQYQFWWFRWRHVLWWRQSQSKIMNSTHDSNFTSHRPLHLAKTIYDLQVNIFKILTFEFYFIIIFFVELCVRMKKRWKCICYHVPVDFNADMRLTPPPYPANEDLSSIILTVHLGCFTSIFSPHFLTQHIVCMPRKMWTRY